MGNIFLENAIKNQIFQAAMENKWKKVQNLYIHSKFARESNFLLSEETALHLAISSYNPDLDDSFQHPHLTCIKEMIGFLYHIPPQDRQRILKKKDEKGNTPLHLAAELGSVPIIECMIKIGSKDRLIWERNLKGETPLFITAYRGKLQAFLYLHQCCQNEKEEDPIKLCRRGDGDNILHAAISGEYFKLAFQIIHYYGPLVNRYNVEGMSPLHILCGMPQAFKSSTHFRFIDSIIYYCTNIEDLELMTYKSELIYLKLHWNLPENFRTMVVLLELFWHGISKIRDYLIPTYFWNQENKSKETSGVTDVNEENSSQGHQSHRQNDLENPPNQDTIGVAKEDRDKKSPDTTGASNENQEKKSPDEWKRNRKLFPANYTIFIEFLKCLMKIVLFVLGIGIVLFALGIGNHRIKQIQERKRRHTWGVQIMNFMIEKDVRYKFYLNTGEKPKDMDIHRRIDVPPTTPPKTVDDTKKKIDDVKSDKSKTKETPLLVASKMGIVEMVRCILKEFPMAIQDKDSDEKNILLLAVEHRQTDVYNWLIGKKYPKYVFYQVDKHGNNAMHLAAMYQKLEVWRFPGSALQLQGERKWYKYVKNTVPPQPYVRYNKKGQTPRQIFRETHANLHKDGTQWLVTTANSFSVVAALIATVAFATSATIPGGADDEAHPHFENQPASVVFSISSLASLCFSVTALVFFLAILTSRYQHKDFEIDLPRKLLLGLTSLFASIIAILITFCAAHFFVLQDKLRTAAFPMYGAICIPVAFFAFNQFHLSVDLIRSCNQNLPLRSYKVFYTDSSEATSYGKEKDDRNREKLLQEQSVE